MNKIEENKEKIIALLRYTKRKGINDLIKFLEQSDYFTAPASARYHLNVEGGLAQHSLNVYENLNHLNSLIGHKLTTEEVIIIGLLHDVCKVNYYIEKPGYKVPYKVDENLPLGHGEKSIYILQKYISLNPKEAVCIRWHMGLFDKSFLSNETYFKNTFPEVYITFMADWLASLFNDMNQNINQETQS